MWHFRDLHPQLIRWSPDLFWPFFFFFFFEPLKRTVPLLQESTCPQSIGNPFTSPKTPLCQSPQFEIAHQQSWLKWRPWQTDFIGDTGGRVLEKKSLQNLLLTFNRRPQGLLCCIWLNGERCLPVGGCMRSARITPYAVCFLSILFLSFSPPSFFSVFLKATA